MLVYAFFWKRMENVRNWVNSNCIKPDDTEEIYKQNKMGFPEKKLLDDFHCFSFIRQKIRFSELIYYGFRVLKHYILHMYETYCNVLKPNLITNL